MTNLDLLLFPVALVAGFIGYQIARYQVMKNIREIEDVFVHTKRLSPKSTATQMAVKLANEIGASGAIKATPISEFDNFPASRIKLRVYVGD